MEKIVFLYDRDSPRISQLRGILLKEYEVLSENSYLDKDTNIKVIEITDDQIVVSKI